MKWILVSIGSALAITACSSGTDSDSSINTGPTTNSTSIAAPTSIPLSPSSDSLIQLIDPLDEPEYYCIDVPGAGNGVRLEEPLQAHTCKLQGQEDELFTIAETGVGPLHMAAYSLCVQADAAESGSQLHLGECADSSLQVFHYSGDDHSVRLVHDSLRLCVVVEAAAGQPTGGPSHLRLDLLLLPCGEVPGNLREWQFPGVVPE